MAGCPHSRRETTYGNQNSHGGCCCGLRPWNSRRCGGSKNAPALAAGCTVILKQRAKTPLCASLFDECVDAHKITPKGFQLVAALRSDFGKEFLEISLPKITFTVLKHEVGKN